MSCLFFADPIAKEHNPGPGHPEQIARWDAAVRGVGTARITTPAARAATEDELALCHTRKYIRTARQDVADHRSSLSTGDTDIGPRSFEAATRAAGLCLNAVDQVLAGKSQRAFCIVRPPGHHATPVRGMGFCLFNNIALAARYAQKTHGVDRVLIADWDVHHGNGTQDIFYSDGSVFFFSTHQSPWYPGTGDRDETGEGDGRGTTMNYPLPAGSGRGEIFPAFENLKKTMDDFKPGMVLISAGFDSRAGDPLGHFRLTDQDFADLTTLMREVADKHSHGRLISILEGGYNLDGLTKAVSAHARVMEL